MYLSIIIPAYNEEKRIPKTLVSIDKYLRKQTYKYEIIVISDGSKDNTAKVVRGLKSQIKNLRLIDNKENHGKGYVVRQAMLSAKGEYRLFTDADNSTTVNQVKKLLPYFKKGYDIVIGSRDVKGAVLDPPQPFKRRFVGNVFNLFVQVIVGLWGIWDTQCGFKAMSAKSVKDILPKCKIEKWAFDPEIMIIGRKMGYKIKEVPIRWVNDLDSKVKLKGMVRMGFDLLKIRLNLLTFRYGILKKNN